jgi:hypothetical protein
MTCLDWKSAALRRLSARFHRERELRFNGKGGVKKALWNTDRCDLTRAPFLFRISDFEFRIFLLSSFH